MMFFFVLVLLEGDMRWLQSELIPVLIVGVMLHLLLFRWWESPVLKILALIIPQLWLLLY